MMKRILYIILLVFLLCLTTNVNAEIVENAFTNGKCIKNTSYKDSVKNNYSLNENDEKFELSGSAFNNTDYIFYDISAEGDTLYAYIPNYNEVIKNEEAKDALYDLGILINENCSNTYVVSKTIVGSKIAAIKNIGKISTPNTASGRSNLTIIIGATLFLVVIIAAFKFNIFKKNKLISTFIFLALFSLVFSNVKALNNLVELISFLPSDNEANALTVKFNINSDDDNYVIELYNPRLARIDRFPSSVEEYTYQNLDSNTIYRVAGRVCYNDNCSSWGNVKEAITTNALIITDNSQITPKDMIVSDTYTNVDKEGEANDSNEVAPASYSKMYTTYNNLNQDEISLANEIKQDIKNNFNVSELQEGIVKKGDSLLTKSINIENSITNSVQKSKIQSIQLYQIEEGLALEGDSNISLGSGDYMLLGVKTLPSGVPSSYTWTSSNNCCSVNQGVVKGLKTGSCTITAKEESGLRASININVTNSSKSIVSDELEIDYDSESDDMNALSSDGSSSIDSNLNSLDSTTDNTNNKKIDLSNAVIDINANNYDANNNTFYYKNEAIQPIPKVVLNNKQLKYNNDYKVQWVNTDRPKKDAHLTIKGIGSYKGSKEKSYKIIVGDTINKKQRWNNNKKHKYLTKSLSGKTYKLYCQQRYGGNGTYSHNVKKSTTNLDGSIYSNGCGPSSIAIILSGYSENKDPKTVGKEMVKTVADHHKKTGSNQSETPSSATYMQLYLNNNGYKTKYHSEDRKKEDFDKAKKYLKQSLQSGHQVVMWVGTTKRSSKNVNYDNYRYFTGSGYHFISILSINKKGTKVFVGNPTSSKQSGWYSIDKLVKARGYKYWLEVWEFKKPVINNAVKTTKGIKFNYTVNQTSKALIESGQVGIEIYDVNTKKSIKKIINSKEGTISINKKYTKIKIRTYIKGENRTTYSKYSNVKSIK